MVNMNIVWGNNETYKKTIKKLQIISTQTLLTADMYQMGFVM